MSSFSSFSLSLLLSVSLLLLNPVFLLVLFLGDRPDLCVCVCFNDALIALLSLLPPSAVDQAPPVGYAANPLYPPRTDHPCFPWYVPTSPLSTLPSLCTCRHCHLFLLFLSFLSFPMSLVVACLLSLDFCLALPSFGQPELVFCWYFVTHEDSILKYHLATTICYIPAMVSFEI